MKQNNIFEKIIITILVLSLILFVGSNIVRYAIAYDLFIPGTELKLKDWYNDAIRLNVLHLFAVASFYTIAGFISAFLSSLILFILKIKDLKRYGWLFMAFVLFFLATPVEIYLIYNDIHLILILNTNEIHSFANHNIQDFFIYRFTKLTIPATLAFLAIITSIIMAIWQPLNNKEDFLNKDIRKTQIKEDKNETTT